MKGIGEVPKEGNTSAVAVDPLGLALSCDLRFVFRVVALGMSGTV